MDIVGIIALTSAIGSIIIGILLRLKSSKCINNCINMETRTPLNEKHFLINDKT